MVMHILSCYGYETKEEFYMGKIEPRFDPDIRLNLLLF